MSRLGLFRGSLLLNMAKDFAYNAHAGQIRDGGEPFINHPMQVAEIIRLVAPDDINLRCAAWLHDTIEDTDTTYQDIVELFGQDVADLVNEVTHESAAQGYYFPRLSTQRGITLKFADRLSNISDMAAWSDKRKTHYLKKSKFWTNVYEA